MFIKKIVYILLILAFISAMVAGCAKGDDGVRVDKDAAVSPFETFRDIPGITEKEIADIERLQAERKDKPFSYAMSHMTESFIKNDGSIGGYAVYVCRWLTELFEIEFVPQIVDSIEMRPKLSSYEVDFSGSIMQTEESMNAYYMTATVAERKFSMVRLADSIAIEEIARSRPLNYAFMNNTPFEPAVATVMEPEAYNVIRINYSTEAYDLLKSGEVDAYVTASTTAAIFSEYSDLVIEDFLPLLFNAVSIATANPELESIITVIKKAQENGAMSYLSGLYNIGYQEFNQHQMTAWLTDEERLYIQNNPTIPITAFNSNYPLCFYDKRIGGWQGIYFDLLGEVSLLTGLSFNVIHDETTQWPAIQEKLINGEGMIVPELTFTRERIGQFLWSDTLIMQDYFALISRSDFKDITINDIQHETIGVARGTTFTAMFRQWFPNHPNTFEYEGIDFAFAALQNGDVDLVMTTERRLMQLTHLQELVGYKANLIFTQPIETRFGYNIDQELLKSIIDKALILVDTNGIADSWMRRTYDYRAQMMEAQRDAQRPWLIGAGVLIFIILLLLLFIFIRKLSESKRLEKQVEARTTEARSASEAKSRFLANMSHEIRSPMNSIIGFAELAKDADDPRKVTNYLDYIEDSATWLLKIINDILDISKIEAGKFALEHVPFNINDIVLHCKAALTPIANEKCISLNCTVEQIEGKMVVGDPVQLRQALVNLMSNAVKFTDEGEVSITVSVIEVREKSANIRFEVKDNGIGMDPDQLSKVFESFTQGDSSISRRFGGTGLGLTITKNIIDMMGGTLNVESSSGVGSVFSFDIVFDIVDDDTESSSSHHAVVIEIERPTFSGEVLVCEDNILNQQVIRDHLERVGLKTTIANNGAECVEIMESAMQKDEIPFGLIFMDIHMPVMDGIAATSKLMEMGVDIPIIALTANIMSDDIKLYKESGMADFIGKPFTSQDLWQCLQKFLTAESVTYIATDEISAMETKGLLQLRLHFVRSNQNTADNIKQALENNDSKLAYRLVHTLKSNAGQIGEKYLQEAAATVEDKLVEDNYTGNEIKEVGRELDYLFTELNKVLDNLASIAAENEMNKEFITDPDEIKEIFDELKQMLIKRNPLCMELLDDIMAIKGAEELADYVEDFNFAKALEELERITENT